MNVRATGGLLMALALASCAGEDRLAAQETKDDQRCLSFGAQKGSDAYVNCRTQLDAARKTALATRQAGGIVAPGLYD